jgi:hypothetical protein
MADPVAADAVLPEDSTVARHPPEPALVLPGPDRALVQGCHETFGATGFAMVTSITMTSFSSAGFMIRSFIPSATAIIHTDTIPTGIIRRTGVIPTDMDTEAEFTVPGMKLRFPRL